MCFPFRTSVKTAAWVALAGLTALRGAPADFQELFNGRDLAGWKGDLTFWSVRDGTITGETTNEHPTKQNTFLIWDGGEVANFELHAKIRIVANNSVNFANSGIQYRSRILIAERYILAGYQADIDRDPAKNYVGQLAEERGRRILAKVGQRVRILPGEPKPTLEVIGSTASEAEIAKSFNIDAWIDFTVIAEGNRLRHFLNGVLVMEAIDLDAKNAAQSGVLGLQLHAGQPMTVQFKDIRLKRLP